MCCFFCGKKMGFSPHNRGCSVCRGRGISDPTRICGMLPSSSSFPEAHSFPPASPVCTSLGIFGSISFGAPLRPLWLTCDSRGIWEWFKIRQKLWRAPHWMGMLFPFPFPPHLDSWECGCHMDLLGCSCCFSRQKVWNIARGGIAGSEILGLFAVFP